MQLSAIDYLTIVAHYESRLAMANPCRKVAETDLWIVMRKNAPVALF